MNKQDRLKKAIEEGEVLKIIYYDGGQSGVFRYISPLQIENGKIRSHCYSSKNIKFFNINQLTIVEKNNSSKIKPWDSDFKENLYYESVSDFINKEIITLTQLGWHIANDKDRVFLYSKPNKRHLYSNNYADIWLVQQKHMNKLKINNLRGILVYGTNKKMLWDVGSKNQNTKTYKTLDKAVGQFMNLARLLAPKLEDIIIYGN